MLIGIRLCQCLHLLLANLQKKMFAIHEQPTVDELNLLPIYDSFSHDIPSLKFVKIGAEN